MSETLINSLITGFFTSLFASIFFYLMLWTLKPRISISTDIAKFKHDLDGKEVTIYAFKVINRTWIHRVMEVKCELLLLETVNTQGGQNVRAKSLKLIRDQIWFIRRRFFNENAHAPYASIFGTFEDLHELWDDKSKRLQFRVICKHSLSGFSKVFDVTYYQRNVSIKNGQFAFGDSFSIN